ncbi:major capsid protein [Arcobacter aquimarinus]|uniref:major capsid protein n=1 Tax=Arcobacter aquimarinus TaxID=1315211 RepID=UPI003BB0EF9E
MAGTISLFTARALTATVNAIFPADNFLTKKFFGRNEPSTSKYVDIVITKGGKHIAPFVSPKLAGKVLKKSGKKLETYEPPLQKPIFQTDAEELLENNSVMYSTAKTPEERAAEELAKELDDGRARIDRRTEWMSASALVDGKISVVGDGVEDEIDYTRNPSHTKVLTGTALWTDTVNSDPRADLDKWRTEVFDNSGVSPTEVVFGRDVANAYSKHPKVLEAFDKKWINRGELKPEKLEAGVTYLGYDAELDLKMYKYVGKYAHPETGADTPYLPYDKLIMGSEYTRTDAHVAFGGIADFKAFRKEGMNVNLFIGEIFAKSYEVEDPSARFVVLQSKPLPIPGNVDSSLSAKVV